MTYGGGQWGGCNSASGCHAKGSMSPPPPATPVSLAPDCNLYNTLLTYQVAACGNLPLVKPGEPDASALPMVLENGCGLPVQQMPSGCAPDGCYGPEYTQAVRTWIANGASPNL